MKLNKIDCKKVCYSSEQFALEDIKRISKRSDRKKIPARAYLCPDCNSWHLTSRLDNKDIRIIELIKENRLLKDHNKRVLLFKLSENEKAISLDNRIIKLNKVIQEKNDLISKLRSSVKDLIEKNIVLNNIINKL